MTRCLGDDAVSSLSQELRSREEELSRAALQQKSQEELLKRREQQLAEREIDVLERELNILIFQLNQEKPNVKRRKGKFKRSRLKLKDGHRISLPSGTAWSSCRPRPCAPPGRRPLRVGGTGRRGGARVSDTERLQSVPSVRGQRVMNHELPRVERHLLPTGSLIPAFETKAEFPCRRSRCASRGQLSPLRVGCVVPSAAGIAW